MLNLFFSQQQTMRGTESTNSKIRTFATSAVSLPKGTLKEESLFIKSNEKNISASFLVVFARILWSPHTILRVKYTNSILHNFYPKPYQY